MLVAIAAILFGVGVTYRAQKKILRELAPPKPAVLPNELNSTAEDWAWTKSEGGKVEVEICAKDFRQVKDASRTDLQGVRLKLFHQDHGKYDFVKSASATFFLNEHRLYSDGAVQITLDMPIEDGARPCSIPQAQPAHKLVSIESSGVTFDSESGHADTDRPTRFIFEHGDGTSNGASYDPNTHQLELLNDAKMNWQPVGPHAQPMLIEAGNVEYRESESQILLKPWGRLTRENTVVEGENPVVQLQDKRIHQITATKAHGSDTYPNRTLQYAADELWVDFNDAGVVQKITAQTNARLVAANASSETTVTAYHVEMMFEPENGQSVLTQVAAVGNSQVSSKPLPVPGRQIGETHILRADQLEMKMRPGGREIASIAALTPGVLEFIPNLPTQHHRTLNGKNIVIAYGPQNRIGTFHAIEVTTQTDPTADERKRKVAGSITTSKEMLARFDPKTSKMAELEQTGDFRYQQGDRRARAAKATLDEDQNVIVLQTAARVSDPTGFTSADRIRMDQKTGDFTAEGHVNSSRMPDKDQQKNSQMLSGDEPLQAQARKVVSTDHNRRIHYEGSVLLWQGANRIQANAVDIDREKRSLIGDGSVVTSLWEEPKDEQKRKTATPVLTVVHAGHLVYTDANRLAVYTGGIELTRVALRVKSRELQAYLAASGADSRLEKAIADGGVEVFQAAKDRTRTGTAEHSEYYTSDQKLILTGGKPTLVDSKDGTAQGAQLTYFANDARLLINGSPGHPAKSQVKQK